MSATKSRLVGMLAVLIQRQDDPDDDTSFLEAVINVETKELEAEGWI